MEFISKVFDELSNAEVYEILKARATIFVKEQAISYVDEDDVDYSSIHCFLWEDNKVKGYLRAYSTEKDDDSIHIGRVLSIEHGKGIGTELMKKSITSIVEKTGRRTIRMDAQEHAISFYEKLGFMVTSDRYLEEGIVHVDMEYTVPD